MNAGKSTYLLQSSYNYQERNMNTLLFTAAIDNRYGDGRIQSRIGLMADAKVFANTDNLLHIAEQALQKHSIHCVMVDESQFLTKQQVYQLAEIADQLSIPVLAFGIRTDFKGELFEGSQYLLAWADNLNEIKTVCHCGRKATMVLRVDMKGNAVKEGSQVEIGGNDRYVSVCRKHFRLNKVD
jgi:thymidine kinase